MLINAEKTLKSQQKELLIPRHSRKGSLWIGATLPIKENRKNSSHKVFEKEINDKEKPAVAP